MMGIGNRSKTGYGYLSGIMFLLLLMGKSNIIRAQQEIMHLKGRVVDNSKEPVSFSAIGVFRATDSGYISGTSADLQGEFEITLPPQDCFLRVTMIGFEDAERQVIRQKVQKISEILSCWR